MANKKSTSKNSYMLKGLLKKQGYDWWWHSLTAINKKTGEEKPFFIEYFTCNPALAEDTPVLGQHPDRQKDGKKPSYIMIKAGTWGKDAKQLHRFIPWKEVTIAKDPILVSGDCFLSENRIAGSIDVQELKPEYMCNIGTMQWDLTVNKQVAFNVGYGSSKFFRTLNAFEMYWHAEGMKTQYSGTITLDGEEYDVFPEKSFGYADKNWGKNFTTPWVWLSSNNIYSEKLGRPLENSVFDIGGGRPKVFGIPLNRKLLSNIWYEGQDLEFNFSKFWTVCRTKFDFKENANTVEWYVRQETTKAIFEITVECKKEDMLLINYESPDGKKRHNKLWNGGNGTGTLTIYKKHFGKKEHLDTLKFANTGCEYGEYDT